MASQSPRSGKPEDENRRYLDGWAALTTLMNEGRSWSGHERNNVFLNLGDGRFADASFVSGLDSAADGRAVAAVDWDRDGDLDLWFKDRTGPQLRLMLNEQSGPQHWVAFRLEGTRTNRDAVGARVEIVAGSSTLSRTVTAGDGYLSQSSPWLHFGLGSIDGIDGIVVTWPGGGEERIDAPPVDARYEIREGSGRAVAVETGELRLGAAGVAPQLPTELVRVLLKVPLPLPPTLRSLVRVGGEPPRAKLINLWAQWCAPCIEELSELAERYDELREAGVDVLAFSVDPAEDRVLAAERFAELIVPKMGAAGFESRALPDDGREAIDAILSHVLGRHEELLLPTSLLIDRQGNLQMVYRGPLSVDRLVADAAKYATDSTVKASRRSLFHGRWYFRTPRPLELLAGDLKRRGLIADADFYLGASVFERP